MITQVADESADRGIIVSIVSIKLVDTLHIDVGQGTAAKCVQAAHNAAKTKVACIRSILSVWNIQG